MESTTTTPFTNPFALPDWEPSETCLNCGKSGKEFCNEECENKWNETTTYEMNNDVIELFKAMLTDDRKDTLCPYCTEIYVNVVVDENEVTNLGIISIDIDGDFTPIAMFDMQNNAARVINAITFKDLSYLESKVVHEFIENYYPEAPLFVKCIDKVTVDDLLHKD